MRDRKKWVILFLRQLRTHIPKIVFLFTVDPQTWTLYIQIGFINGLSRFSLVGSRDVPSTRQLFDGRVLNIILFKTQLSLGTRRNTTFLLDSYPMANADNLFINICIHIINITETI